MEWSMKSMLIIMLIGCSSLAHGQLTPEQKSKLQEALKTEPELLNEVLKKVEPRNEDAQSEDITMKIDMLIRQLRSQMFHIEEQTRSNGQSGLKQIRVNHDGTKPYYTASHAGRSVAAIHDHANNIRTVGLGEFIAVLNGVEFRTRHNDYSFRMPSTTTSDYHATEPIQFPDVPPEVTDAGDVSAQVAEMQKWFQAWQDQDSSERDYRRYFKPVLCYLEGAWTTSDPTGEIEEPFESDRHHVDASSWYDLIEKVMFTSYTGGKDNDENYAYLPTQIFNVSGSLTWGQYNYRILCHPLQRDLPLNRLRPVDDLQARVANGLNMDEVKFHRSTRFSLSPDDSDKFVDKRYRHGLLDELMEEIPGKNNYAANLTDDAFGYEAQTLNEPSGNLNAGFYHRNYKIADKDASGLQLRHRAFSDSSLFFAKTTHRQIIPAQVEKCPKNKRQRRLQGCKSWSQRWTYAIPLEIIYLTPLSTWNPYNIVYHGDAKTSEGKSVYLGPNQTRRNGQCSTSSSPTVESKAFNGTNSKVYYITPDEFFTAKTSGRDTADTTRKSAVCVLDSNGNVRRVRASGTRIFLPPIGDLGVMRQRYPIMPVHGEGSSVWKELSAFKEAVLDSTMMQSTPHTEIRLRLPAGRADHTHDVVLTPDQMASLKGGQRLTIYSESAVSHNHALVLVIGSDVNCPINVVLCDSIARCRDGHRKKLCKNTN